MLILNSRHRGIAVVEMLILLSRYRGIVATQGNYPQKCCHSAMVQKYIGTKTVGKTANGKRGTGLQESIMSRFFKSKWN